MNVKVGSLSLVVLLAATAAAESAAPPLPPALAETLRWFPADVDAFVVASDFTLADASAVGGDPQGQQAWLVQDPVPTIFRTQASGRVYRETDGGSSVPSEEARELRAQAYAERIDQFWALLADRRVEFAVLGAREVFPTSAFGFCGYAGCHVVRFTNELGADADAMTRKLRAGADSVIKLEGREIAAFNWKFPKEPYLKTRPWEGLFVLIPKGQERDLLIATQRELLEQVVARRAHPAAQRAALPPELPIWRTVDTAAPVWAVFARPTAANASDAAKREVIAVEYHSGKDARFILCAPSQSIPDDPQQVDPSARPAPPLPARVLHHLRRSDIEYSLDRPPGETARITVSFTGDRRVVAQRGMAMIFITGSLMQQCFD